MTFPNLTPSSTPMTRGLFYETGPGDLKVYLKTLPKYASSNVRLLFDKEIALHQQLQHANIVKLYDAVPSMEEVPVMIFEYMNEGSLESHLNGDATSFSWERKVGIVCDIAAAISFLHANDLTHGNLLPSHVLLDSAKPTKITGLCSNEQADSQLEISAVQLDVMSCLYVAPEVVLDDTSSDPPADVFALGCLMWTVDLMAEIYSTHTDKKIEFHHLMEWITSGTFDAVPREFSVDCPDWYVALAKECMLFDPSARPTIDAVLDRLAAAP
ncbi:hypothetical protein ACHHYP_13215 [Achlya hypogyna]|uniref:Protein kinase domain-containing protein n=1 Tax=Achlya hypogyna TaxID=1202772 RepID=A0A1V9ZFT4_ACHHY|nr:hypothetical protein ACHHYP_13215 [Achlya hypogyna]